jgi:hypothetical protein
MLHATSDHSIGNERANNFPWRPSKLEIHICCRVYFSCRRTYDSICVSSQVDPTVERRLKSAGFRLGIDLMLKHRNKPYMSSQLFAEYISTVLLPCVDVLRSNEEFSDKEAVLLMDNCSVHVQGDTLQMLADHGVKVLLFLPHTIHIFQSLDSNLFWNFKNRMNYRLPSETDRTTAGFIQRILHIMKQTLVENNLRSSFMQLGFTYDIDITPYMLIFGERVFQQSPGLTSLWKRDYPVEKLWKRRRNATFGWINKIMCPDWDSRE